MTLHVFAMVMKILLFNRLRDQCYTLQGGHWSPAFKNLSGLETVSSDAGVAYLLVL